MGTCASSSRERPDSGNRMMGLPVAGAEEGR